MTVLSHHELGKWLTDLSMPVLDRFSSHCISNSFTCANIIQRLELDPDVFMGSFDVPSLFTNVSLNETFKICLAVLYDKSDLQSLTAKDVLVELMKHATFLVEFSFNNIMHKKTNGVAMRSPFVSSLNQYLC